MRQLLTAKTGSAEKREDQSATVSHNVAPGQSAHPAQVVRTSGDAVLHTAASAARPEVLTATRPAIDVLMPQLNSSTSANAQTNSDAVSRAAAYAVGPEAPPASLPNAGIPTLRQNSPAQSVVSGTRASSDMTSLLGHALANVMSQATLPSSDSTTQQECVTHLIPHQPVTGEPPVPPPIPSTSGTT